MSQKPNSRRSISQVIGHEILRWICRLLMILYFRFRVHGLRHYPAKDGFLICSNHQSHLDPVILGVACPRPINTIGRSSLTQIKWFGKFLYWLDLIAIDREGGGLEGMKTTLKRLKRGESVLIFPEGTRTSDGYLQPLKLGFATIARRAKVPILPIAFDGGFEAMPRSSWWIRPVNIQLVFGPPIAETEYRELSDEALAKLLSERLETCFLLAHHLRTRSGKLVPARSHPRPTQAESVKRLDDQQN